jgi:hypothetical protein
VPSQLLSVEDAEATALSGQYSPEGVDIPLPLPADLITAEATRVTLTLVALRNEQPIIEIPLVLSVRLSVDSAVHLWSDDSAALTAALALDTKTRSIRLNLRFAATRKRASAAAHAAALIKALQSGAKLALRGPDGNLIPERLEVSPELRIDDRLVRFLNLLQDLEYLSGTPIPVPEFVDEATVGDLLTARRLLRGEEVHGKWTTGEMRFEREVLPLLRKALADSTRHEFMHVATMRLELPGAVIELGEVQEVMRDAEVEELREDNDEVVLRLRAHGGSAPSLMRPTNVRVLPVPCRYEVAEEVFRELLEDLDGPPRDSALRRLL